MTVRTFLRRTLPVVGFTTILGLATSSQAAFVSGIIGVDFNSTKTFTFTGAGVIGASGDTWNTAADSSGTGLTLSNSLGGATGATMDYLAGSSHNWSTGGNLLRDSLMTGSSTEVGTVTIHGLDSSLTYNLYIYGGGSVAGRVTDYTVVGATTSPTKSISMDIDYTTTPSTTYVLGTRYQTFSLKPDASGNIQIQFKYGGGVSQESNRRGTIGGFQITPVPEPAAASLFALGGLALMGRRKRRA